MTFKAFHYLCFTIYGSLAQFSSHRFVFQEQNGKFYRKLPHTTFSREISVQNSISTWMVQFLTSIQTEAGKFKMEFRQTMDITGTYLNTIIQYNTNNWLHQLCNKKSDKFQLLIFEKNGLVWPGAVWPAHFFKYWKLGKADVANYLKL